MNIPNGYYMITTQNEVEHIKKCSYFGMPPEIGDYAKFLGGTDGGFLVKKAYELEAETGIERE